MRDIQHPLIEQITLSSFLHALSDPVRLDIVRQLAKGDALTCGQLAPNRPKSSMSHHFKILRDAGLIRTEPRGKEHYNSLRRREIDIRFPGVLSSVLAI
ncbi:Helix-turn-helix domain protein [compost metagenome]